MSLARKIATNTLWQIVGKIVTAVLGIISIKYITNYLSPTSYGQYTTIYDYTALFAIIADFGLFTIAVREMAHIEKSEGKEGIERILGSILSIRTLLAIISLGIGAIIAFLIPAYQGTAIPHGVIIVSVATVITLMAGTTSSILQFHLRMHWASIALSVGKLITVLYILMVILWAFPNDPIRGFPHLLIAWIVGGLCTMLITYSAAAQYNRIAFYFDPVFWKKVMKKALPYGFALMLGTMYFRMGTIVMSLYGMQTQIGYFGVPMRFLEILQIIPHYFMNSVLPELTRSLELHQQRAEKIVRYSINALATLALPIFVGGYLLSWEITAAVSSPEFLTQRIGETITYGSDIGLKILLGAVAFTFLHVVFTYTLVAKGMQKQVLKANAIGMTINTILNFSLAPRYGFIGASISAVLTEAVMFITLAILMYRYSDVRHIWDRAFLLKILAAATTMGAALILIDDPLSNLLYTKSLFILIPVGILVFGAVLYAMGGVNKEFLKLFMRKET